MGPKVNTSNDFVADPPLEVVKRNIAERKSSKEPNHHPSLTSPKKYSMAKK